ncbi:MAG TPA: 2-oxoglutarate and iron-dependent oxygenase domain-containing protein [Acidimicrobiia bacterium]|nr:2-oxoglutarate and iron-dependent oxygenase domain-containing protein [Acidimicrobiia bacterium]
MAVDPAVPVVDVAPLMTGAGAGDVDAVAAALDRACRDTGFFTIVGHGVDPRCVARVDRLSREFFGLDDEEKARIAMAHGGRAWRGWFPLGGELTSGRPDRKEGLYFAAEHPGDARPLHGANLFPERPVEMRAAVLEYLDAMTRLGHQVMRGLARALGLDDDWFAGHLTGDPTVLLRVFRYPPHAGDDAWGVGEHTDYGLLTMLAQDDAGGLEVRTRTGWRAVPPVRDALVCNIGDMLDRMTGGEYQSTAHRVRNTSDRDRIAIPFFFDPAWDARVRALPGRRGDVTGGDRWDGQDLHGFEGTYGDYLVAKVSKVFPALREGVL